MAPLAQKFEGSNPSASETVIIRKRFYGDITAEARQCKSIRIKLNMFSSIDVVAKRVILFNREIISLLRLGVMVSDVANKHVSVKHTISDAAMRLQKAAKQAAISIPASRMSRALFVCLFL